MLLFDLLDQACEEQLHFVLHQVEFRNFSVWVLVEYALDLTPFHLLAGFMK